MKFNKIFMILLCLLFIPLVSAVSLNDIRNEQSIINLSQYLNINGISIMEGSLNMGGFNISNLLNPVYPQDAVTKNYVDLLMLNASNYNSSYLTSNYNATYDAKPDSTYNATYDAYSNYNGSYIISTYNATYDAKPDSTYNATYDAKTNYNASYLTSNYNATYDAKTNYNASYLTSTYNATYDAKTNTNYNISYDTLIGKDGYTIFFQKSAVNPSKNTYNDVGNQFQSTAGTQVYVLKSGTITAATGTAYVAGTAGTSEAWNLSIRRNLEALNGINFVGNNATTAREHGWSNTSMNLPVVAGDNLQLWWGSGNWVIAPTTVTFTGYVYIST